MCVGQYFYRECDNENALKLFRFDLKRIAKTPAVWIIIAGLAILPSFMPGSIYGPCGIHIVRRIILK